MFSNVKMPKNLCEFRLFRGAADFGNLEQWDLYETGYSFLTVVSVPEFLQVLANEGSEYVNKEIASRLLNNFVYILEHEFRGLSGLGGLTGDGTTITDGISELQMINKVTEDTSVTVDMKFFEKSGRPITKLAELFLRGIKDSRTQGKHYWGLIEANRLEPGFECEVFNFLYYITDNTYRRLEAAVLLMCAQIKEAPMDDIFNTEKGQYSNPEISLTFNAFPVQGDDVNREAARLLEYLLSEDAGKDRLIIDTMSAKDFYHVGGGKNGKTVSQAIKSSYGLRMTGSTTDASGYSGNDSSTYTNNYSKYESAVKDLQKGNKYGPECTSYASTVQE